MQHLQGQLSSQQEQMQAAAGLQVELQTTRQSLNAVLQAEAEKAEELGTFRESNPASVSLLLPHSRQLGAEAGEAEELELLEQRHCRVAPWSWA